MPPAPLRLRARIVDEGGVLTITIPSRAQFGTLFVLLIWLGAWAMGELFALGELFTPGQNGVSAFMVIWFIGWSIAGLGALWSLTWMYFGRETLRFENDRLSRRAPLSLVGGLREYELAEMKNLRPVTLSVLAMLPQGKSLRISARYNSGGDLAFDYRGETVQLGKGLGEAEATVLAEQINARFPALAGRPESQIDQPDSLGACRENKF